MEYSERDNKIANRTLGSLLLESGKISEDDALAISKVQHEDGIRFGDAALKLGLVKDSDIQMAISKQFDYSFLSHDDESVDHCLISAFVSSGPEIEALKSLRSQLSLQWLNENHSLVVCSAVSGNGASYTSANLSVLFSQLGLKTLLIDANMRHPCLNLCFNTASKKGLSDMLVGRAGMEAVTPIKGIENLFVLFSGTPPPNPMELLGHSRFKALHSHLQGLYDVIIVDAPPINEFSDTELLASVVKGVVIVARKEAALIKDLKQAKLKVQGTGAAPLGVVLNNF